MKSILIFLQFTTWFYMPDHDPYKITFNNLGGEKINLSAWQGRKIIIAVFDASSPDPLFFSYVDSLQSEEKNTKVIAFPALDFGGKATISKLQGLKDSLRMKIEIAAPAYVKKTSSKQHELFSWITHVTENNHFDIEIEEPGQIFIISPKGTLYAGLRTASKKNVINQVISDNTIE